MATEKTNYVEKRNYAENSGGANDSLKAIGGMIVCGGFVMVCAGLGYLGKAGTHDRYSDESGACAGAGLALMGGGPAVVGVGAYVIQENM